VNLANESGRPFPAPAEGQSATRGEVYRLACLEVSGGNRAAVYEVELPGLDAWVSCRPLQPATRGGDLYYLSICGQGSISRITLADVSGHGESVSSLAERLREALREYADHWDQSALIRLLNESFFRVSTPGKFATAVLLGHYVDTGEVLFINAGHLPPLWYRSAAREWSLLEEKTPYSKEVADLPLGIISGTAYTQTAVQLEPGDVLLLYTDGIIECRNDHGEQLGLDGLLEISRGLRGESASEVGKALVEAIARFRGSAVATDDETVVALCRRPRSEVRG
jgi:sigma-B regulation protein RsbU (phosphoserine phosphatase)